MKRPHRREVSLEYELKKAITFAVQNPLLLVTGKGELRDLGRYFEAERHDKLL